MKHFLLILLCAFSYLTRVFDAEHFDDIRRDTPEEQRPPSLVVFFRPGSCEKRMWQLNLAQLRKAEDFPSRSQLHIALYDMSSHAEKWYTFYPHLHDLPARYNVTTRCPAIVMVDRGCPFFRECDNGFHIYDEAANEDLQTWILSHLRQQMEFKNPFMETRYIHIRPKSNAEKMGSFPVMARSTLKVVGRIGDLIKVTSTYPMRSDIEMEEIMPEHGRGINDLASFPDTSAAEVERRDKLLSAREKTTCMTYVRNNNIPQTIPKLATGIKKMKAPEGLIRELTEFLDENMHRTHMEEWDESQTQLNYFIHPTRLIYLDWDPVLRNRLADQYVKPLLQEWSGIQDIEFQAFYGIREYVNGSWLRGHIDRVSTHVLSATITLRVEGMREDWPLKVIMPDGTQQSITTEPGTMVLYESARIVHGRPSVFDGSTYYACFVHYRPVNTVEDKPWESYVRRATNVVIRNSWKCDPMSNTAYTRDIGMLMLVITAACVLITGKATGFI